METKSLPFHNKSLIPKDGRDRGMFVFMIIIIPFTFFWEIWISYQYYSSLNFVLCLHIALQIFIIVNIIGNLYYLKTIDASGKQKKLPSILKPGWRYCYRCELNSPPRSYHCPICNECVLRRDRHCMFAGCCVGFHNHRYYLFGILYVLIGAAYSSLYQFSHYIETVGYSFKSLFTLVAPHIAVLTGYLTLYGFLVTVIQIILLLGTCLASFLLLQQILGIIYGQTWHEQVEDINPRNLGLYKNFIQIVGRQWCLALLSPFSSSEVPGDGLSFVNIQDLEEVKDL